MTGQKPTIAITGVTGKLGGTVATGLQDLVPQLRLLVRDAGRVPRLEGDVAVMEYGDAEASRKALTGVDVLFMVSAGENPDRVHQHQVFVEAAAAAGVGHIVYTSFLAAAPDATFTLARDHWYTEQHIRESGMAWTFLRDSFYLDFFPGMVDEHGVMRGPAGNGRVGAVARQDVAQSAVAVLRDPSPHAERTYDMTGPEVISVRPRDGRAPTGRKPWRRPTPRAPTTVPRPGRSTPGCPPTPRSPPGSWTWSPTASGP